MGHGFQKMTQQVYMIEIKGRKRLALKAALKSKLSAAIVFTTMKIRTYKGDNHRESYYPYSSLSSTRTNQIPQRSPGRKVFMEGSNICRGCFHGP